MPRIKVTSRDMAPRLKAAIKRSLSSRAAPQVLASNARKRIREGGDSEIKYQELWAVRHGVGYRKNGNPLQDTGALMRGLSGTTKSGGDTITWTLLDGVGYGVKHQHGFTNQAPIAVPISKAAKRRIPSESPHDIDQLKNEGLRQAKSIGDARIESDEYDFYVIWEDAKVPARPIFRLPPEDVKAITGTILRSVERELRG
jgi:phage gpG-like protein